MNNVKKVGSKNIRIIADFSNGIYDYIIDSNIIPTGYKVVSSFYTDPDSSTGYYIYRDYNGGVYICLDNLDWQKRPCLQHANQYKFTA